MTAHQTTAHQTTVPATTVRGKASPDAIGRGASTAALMAGLLGFFLIGLDVSVVNVALPAIGRGIGGSTSALQWIVDAYTLMFAALLLSAGAFSDRFGASRAFLGGLVAFTLASAACGFAPSLGLLVGARLVQGGAAAVVLPSSLALIRQAFPDAAARSRAIAVWTAGGALGTVLGPTAGGVLTNAVSWRAVFFLNLPVGLVILVALARAPRSPRRPAALDLLGQATAIVGLGGLTFGVIEGGASGFARPAVIVGLLVAVVAMAVFAVVERRTADPMVPLGLFRDRTVAVCVTVGFVINAAFYGMLFVIGLFFQEILDQSAIVAGLMFLPMSVLTVGANIASARVARRHGPRLPMALGQVVCAAGMLVMLTVGTGTPRVLLVLMLLPVGGGLGFAVPSLTAAMMDGVTPERAGMAGGLLNSCRQTGGALAVAAFGALVAQRSSFVTGMRTSLLVSAVLLLATAAAPLTLPRARR